jgi:hypothetical protein
MASLIQNCVLELVLELDFGQQAANFIFLSSLEQRPGALAP